MRYIYTIVILAFVSGLVWSYGSWADAPKGGDGLHYNNLAVSLVTEGRYAEDGNLDARRDPGYVFFIAAIYKIFGLHSYVVNVVQLLLFISIALTSYFISLILFHNFVMARLTGILLALFYPLASYVGIFFTEILFTELLLLSLYFFIRAYQTDKIAYYAVSAIALGAASLTRSLIFYFPLVLMVLFLVSHRHDLKKTAVTALVFLFAFSVTVGPWMLRNYKVFGEAKISVQEGSVLYFAAQRLKISNSDLPKVLIANTLGDFFARKIWGSYNRQNTEEGNFGERITQLSESNLSTDEQNSILKTEAIEAIKKQPLRYIFVVPPIEFLKLYTPIFPLESIQGLFSDPNRYRSIPDFIKGLIILTVRFCYLIFFVIAFYGIIKNRARWKEVLPVLLIILYMTGVYSVIHGIPRYILPLYPYFAIFFSFSVVKFMEKKKDIRSI